MGMASLEVVDYRTKVALEGLTGHLQRSVFEEVPEQNCIGRIIRSFLQHPLAAPPGLFSHPACS